MARSRFTPYVQEDAQLLFRFTPLPLRTPDAIACPFVARLMNFYHKLHAPRIITCTCNLHDAYLVVTYLN